MIGLILFSLHATELFKLPELYLFRNSRKTHNHGRGMKSILQICVHPQVRRGGEGPGRLHAAARPAHPAHIPPAPVDEGDRVNFVLLCAGPAEILHINENGMRLDDSITLV